MRFKKTVTLNVDVNKVWEALTKPEWTKKYMPGIEVISNWEIGSPILWKGRVKGDEKIIMKGSIERIEAGKLLQFTALDLNIKCSDVPSNYVRAKYELTSKFGKTILSVTQGDYSHVTNGQKRFNDADDTWNQALNSLKMLIDKKI